MASTWKVSPSQIGTYERCARRWGFRYIDGIADPPGPGALFGTEVHGVLENHFRHGIAPDAETRAGRLASFGLSLYPAPNVIEFVEKKFEFVRDGITFRGIVDLTWDAEPRPVICDHKTSKDPKKYALTEETIPDDVQAIVYSVWGLEYWETDAIDLQWTYYQTADRKTPKVYSVGHTMGAQKANDKFRLRVLPTAREIVKAKDTINSAGELPASPSACGDFGGCAFAEFCTLTSDEKMRSAFGESKGSTMGLKDMLAAKNKGKAPPPRPGTPEFAAAINPPEQPPNVETARGVSRVVEQATGSPATKKETSRAVANAAATAESAEDAEAAAQAVLDEREGDAAAKKAKSLTRDEVLARLAQKGKKHFTSSKAKATATIPYVSGKTLAAMERDGLVNMRTDYPEKGLKTVMPTETAKQHAVYKGQVDAEECREAVAATEPAAELSPANEAALTPPAAVTHSVGNVSRTEHYGGPKLLAAIEQDSTHRERFYAQLLLKHSIKEAKDKFAEFNRVFGGAQ